MQHQDLNNNSYYKQQCTKQMGDAIFIARIRLFSCDGKCNLILPFGRTLLMILMLNYVTHSLDAARLFSNSCKRTAHSWDGNAVNSKITILNNNAYDKQQCLNEMYNQVYYVTVMQPKITIW